MERDSDKVTNCLSPEQYIQNIRKLLDITAGREKRP